MRGTVDVGKFSSAVLEGLCWIIEEEMLAIYHRLSPTLKQRLQEAGEKTRNRAKPEAEIHVAEDVQQSGVPPGGDEEI